MTKFHDLPQGVVDLISEHLDKKALRSASLSLRPWTQAYKRRCCESLDVNLLSESSQGAIKVLKRWESHGLLEWVRHLRVDDSGVRSQDGQFLLEQLFDYWIPQMTGLRSIRWDLSRKPTPDEPAISPLPRGVRLDVVCEGSTPAQTVSEILESLRRCDNLGSLAIEVPSEIHDTFGLALKEILLRCKSLTALKITADQSTAKQSDSQTDGRSPSDGRFCTVEEVHSFPALRDLSLDNSALVEDLFRSWALHGDWTSLKSLATHHDWVLAALAGRLPALESLSVSIVPSLPVFLELQQGLQNLIIMKPQPFDGGSCDISGICNLLALSFGAELKTLKIRPQHRYGDVEVMKEDFQKIATSCPRLESLDVAISRDQYRNAVNFFCWLDHYIQAVVSMPKLRRISLHLPRIIAPGTVDSPQEITTIDLAAQLGSNIAAHGKRLREVRLVASMVNEFLPPDFADRYKAVVRAIPSSSQAFTFIARLPEKDWLTELGTYTTCCPELEQAEEELLRGRLSRLSLTGEYTGARRVVDDMSILVYNGTIVPKRKIRPMPVWLTPWQEQDRKEGPPGPGRRAKRLLISTFNDFTGAFRPPFTETTPRSAQERANARENGFGGKPGWSKSSFATNVVLRR